MWWLWISRVLPEIPLLTTHAAVWRDSDKRGKFITLENPCPYLCMVKTSSPMTSKTNATIKILLWWHAFINTWYRPALLISNYILVHNDDDTFCNVFALDWWDLIISLIICSLHWSIVFFNWPKSSVICSGRLCVSCDRHNRHVLGVLNGVAHIWTEYQFLLHQITCQLERYSIKHKHRVVSIFIEMIFF